MKVNEMTVAKTKILNMYLLSVGKVTTKNFIRLAPLFCILLFSNAMRAESVCEKLNANSNILSDESPIAAEYKYTITDTQKKIQQEKTLTLWRRERQVVIQTTENHPSELWELTNNNQLRVTRFFEKEERGIEYQPSEVQMGREKEDWSFKYQLISDVLINRMSNAFPKVSSEHKSDKAYKDCSDIQNLFLNENSKEIELSWLPSIKLMISLLVKEPHVSTQWQLQKTMTDEKTVNEYFSRLTSYQTTDYADIGDSESDPFLMKMIHLGFVEHGASGFYDSAGNNLSDGKSHSH